MILKTGLEECTTQRRHEFTSSRLKWRMQKRLDLVDTLLDRETREQDPEWANYEVEEQEAKLIIANTLFDTILKDTLDCLQVVFLKKHT